MAHANPYNINNDFSEDARVNRPDRSSVNTSGLDTEFNLVSQSIQQIIANQKLIQRDDGKLGDATVQVHTLSREVLMLLGGYRLRGNWIANTDYAVSDVVVNESYLYVCKNSHTSTLTFDEIPNWIAFGFAGSIEAGLAAIAAQNASNAAELAAQIATSAANDAEADRVAADSALESANFAKDSALTALNSANAASASANAARDFILNAISSTEDGRGDALICVKQPGDGSIKRTQHQKNMDIVSVADFATQKGLSVNDQTDAVQKAINFASASKSAIIDDFHTYRVSSSLTVPQNLSRIKTENLCIEKKISSARSSIFIGDSITELRYLDSFVLHTVDFMAERNGGVKEVGYIPLSSAHTKVFDGFTVSRSANTIPMWGSETTPAGGWDLSPFCYSPDGKGIYTVSAANDYIAVDFSKPIKFNKVRLFYLEQVGGGYFDFGYQYTPTSGLLRTNTVGTASVLKSIDYDVRPEDSFNIRIKNINGKTAFYGIELLNDSGFGYAYTDFSRNGILLQDFLKLDQAATTLYFNKINPDHVYIEIGTNDCNAGVLSSVFKTDLINYISRIKAGAPNCEIIIIEPPQPSFYYSPSTLYSEYTAKRIEVAQELDCGYIHLPSMIGSYGEMLGLNAMEDTVHPNSKGKKLMAEAVCQYMQDVIQGSDYNYPQHSLVSDDEYIFKKGATETVPNGTAKLIGKIGLTSSNVNAFLTIETRFAYGNNLVVQRAFAHLYKDAILARGKLNFVNAFRQENVLASSQAGGVPTISISMTVNANNELEIYATPGGTVTSAGALFSPSTWRMKALAYSNVPVLGASFIVEL